MKKLLVLFLLLGPILPAAAEDTVYFKAGPLTLHIPFKSAAATYMYDFHNNNNLVGGETTIVTLWDKIEGIGGVVTSLQGEGAPFIGGNFIIGNILDRWLNLPPAFKFGGFGGYDFRADTPMYGLKASVAIW